MKRIIFTSNSSFKLVMSCVSSLKYLLLTPFLLVGCDPASETSPKVPAESATQTEPKVSWVFTKDLTKDTIIVAHNEDIAKKIEKTVKESVSVSDNSSFTVNVSDIDNPKNTADVSLKNHNAKDTTIQNVPYKKEQAPVSIEKQEYNTANYYGQWGPDAENRVFLGEEITTTQKLSNGKTVEKKDTVLNRHIKKVAEIPYDKLNSTESSQLGVFFLQQILESDNFLKDNFEIIYYPKHNLPEIVLKKEKESTIDMSLLKGLNPEGELGTALSYSFKSDGIGGRIMVSGHFIAKTMEAAMVMAESYVKESGKNIDKHTAALFRLYDKNPKSDWSIPFTKAVGPMIAQFVQGNLRIDNTLKQYPQIQGFMAQAASQVQENLSGFLMNGSHISVKDDIFESFPPEKENNNKRMIFTEKLTNGTTITYDVPAQNQEENK